MCIRDRGISEPLGALPVQGQVLAVQIQKPQAAKLLLRQLGHMAGGAKGVAAAHHHRELLKQVHQPLEGEEEMCIRDS